MTGRLIQEESEAFPLRAECPGPQIETINVCREQPEDIFAFALPILAGAIGWIAWSGSLYLLAFSALLPSLWSRTPSRFAAGLVVFSYYAMAARGLIPGTQVFFGSYGLVTSTFLGLLFVGTSAAILASPWCLFWTRNFSPIAAAWRLLAVFVLASVPPIGLLGWANPITSVGVLFPGWGWYGLAAVLIAMWLSIHMKRPFYLLTLLLFCALPSAFYNGPPTPPPGWQGMDTHFGRANSSALFFSFYEQNRAMIAAALAHNDASVLVFPESAAGPWNQTTAMLWREASRSFGNELTVLFGAEHFEEEKHQDSQAEAAIIAQGANTGIVYRQRIPMPVSVWRPFASHGARLHWLDSGVFTLHRQRVAALICYEQVLIWPVLFSMTHQPEVIIAPANAWWSRNTSIPAVQHAVLAVWSRLFRIPVVTAFNY